MFFRLFIDEVGNGDLKGAATDPNIRFLSLTGVLTRVDLHEKIIQPQIDGLKKRLFGHTPATPVILHRRELVRKEGAFKVLRDAKVELDFNSNILKRFRDLPYLVITVQIDKKAHLDAYTIWHYDPYHYCTRCLIERYVRYLERHLWVGDIMVEARFKKVDKKLKASVERIYFNGTEHLSSRTIQRHIISKDILMRPKQSNIAGLQLADLIAYPSARYMRCERDGISHPQDFGGQIVDILIERRYRRHHATLKIDGFGTKWLP